MKKQICYLTFDDGPSDFTPQILEILKKEKIKAAFFVVKNDKTEYLKLIKKAGHSIGLHTASHNYEKIYKSEEAYFEDLEEIKAHIAQVLGDTPRILRFPGGSANVSHTKYCPGLMKILVKRVEERGYHYFDWNIAVEKDDRASKEETLEYAITEINRCKDAKQICILLHDLKSKNNTIEALPDILAHLKKNKYIFRKLTVNSKEFHQISK